MTDYTDHDGDTGLNPQRSATVPFAECAAPVPAVPAFDAAKYRAHLEPFSLTNAQEGDLLETLWSMMYAFVELGFETDVCSLIFGASEEIASKDACDVDSLKSPFTKSASEFTEDGPV